MKDENVPDTLNHIKLTEEDWCAPLPSKTPVELNATHAMPRQDSVHGLDATFMAIQQAESGRGEREWRVTGTKADNRAVAAVTLLQRSYETIPPFVHLGDESLTCLLGGVSKYYQSPEGEIWASFGWSHCSALLWGPFTVLTLSHEKYYHQAPAAQLGPRWVTLHSIDDPRDDSDNHFVVSWQGAITEACVGGPHSACPIRPFGLIQKQIRIEPLAKYVITGLVVLEPAEFHGLMSYLGIKRKSVGKHKASSMVSMVLVYCVNIFAGLEEQQMLDLADAYIKECGASVDQLSNDHETLSVIQQLDPEDKRFFKDIEDRLIMNSYKEAAKLGMEELARTYAAREMLKPRKPKKHETPEEFMAMMPSIGVEGQSRFRLIYKMGKPRAVQCCCVSHGTLSPRAHSVLATSNNYYYHY